ncbi:Crp/Fnr family transcriptional regulator [Aerosakkonema funiforme]|uniref:Crp/Fnr family transcriptional regulator n=1 Tax=Aerosakkonema funiforme FACHB-1375 TaxID=2949571 RepID=A0A926ZEJ5_9CYAN|nr:Crp/Fnr family transcriptional regulator [Aerosakkonema funiforme]MBD2179724.1 Crp/Fnr family transcriptional regulator [Aerosakkonema funiforme FACHB-1375]
MALSVPAPLNLNNLKQVTFSCSDLLPLHSDNLWKIERGIVRTLTWSEDGRPITLGFWGAGDVVGKPLSGLEPYQIECLTSVEVCLVPSHLWYQIMDACILHIQQNEEILCIIHNRPIQVRLLQLLNWLACKFGREVEAGKLIELPLTHQALSEVICTTRVTVTRLLNQFEQEGILSRRGRFLILGKQKQIV